MLLHVLFVTTHVLNCLNSAKYYQIALITDKKINSVLKHQSVHNAVEMSCGQFIFRANYSKYGYNILLFYFKVAYFFIT